jgi:hypothetical protein
MSLVGLGAITAPGGSEMIAALFTALVVLLVATFPATWLLMLFLGNTGVNVSYWGALPLGILSSSLIGAAGSRTT